MRKKFLPNTSIARIRNLEKKETDPKAKARLLACIQRKQGNTLEQIAKNLNTPQRTIRRWLKNIQNGGLRRRHDIKNKGAECKLNRRQIAQLVRDLESGPEKFGYETSMWTMPLVNMHIKKKFDVDYEVHSVWELIRRLGFRLVKPRPKLQNSATQKEIDTFKKSSQAGKKVDQKGIHRIDGRRGPHRAWIRAQTGLVSSKKAGHPAGKHKGSKEAR